MICTVGRAVESNVVSGTVGTCLVTGIEAEGKTISIDSVDSSKVLGVTTATVSDMSVF